MKRLLLAIVALLTLLVGFAQLQNVMPSPLQRLMDDLHSSERMMNAHRINNGYKIDGEWILIEKTVDK